MFLLLPLHRIIHQNPALQDMQLPFREPTDLWQKRAPRVLERIGQAESKHEAAEDREGAHERKQPEPAWFTADAAHV